MSVIKNSLKHNLDWVLVALVLMAGAEFAWRGPIRLERAQSMNDFISPYIQTRAWMHGKDPYSPSNLVALWPPDAQAPAFLAKDLSSGSLVLKRGIPTAYPPTSFLLLAPLASLPWHIAFRVWLILMLLSFGFTISALLSIARFEHGGRRTYLFLAFALGLAPFQTGMGTGNIVIVVVCLCAVAIWAEDLGHFVRAGILIAMAVSLKPQIGLPLLAYYLLRKNWRLGLTTISAVTFLAIVAIAILKATSTPWLENYGYDNRVLFSHGSLGDFTEVNPLRFGLINLQVLLYTFSPRTSIANAGALLVTLALGAFWLVQLLRNPNPAKDNLLEISALVTITLLPAYHRLYDASLLIFPLAWIIASTTNSNNALRKGILFLILVFLVPGGTGLEQWQHSGHMVALQHSWIWLHFVMPHQVWSLVFLSCALLLQIHQNTAQERQRTVMLAESRAFTAPGL